MSVNDPLPEPFEERREPEAPPGDAISRPPADYLDALPVDAGTSPEAGPSYPGTSRKPTKPHPGLGFSLLWMLLFFILTQGAGAAVLLALIILQAALSANPEGSFGKMLNPDYIYSAEVGRLELPAFAVAEVVSIALGWLVLRLVAGRDWPRKVALRRPSLAHLGLALLIFPALVLVGQGVGELANKLPLPHLVDLRKFMDQVGDWPWALAVLIIGFGPGIGEELWCRGFIGRGLVGHYGLVLGIVFTSVLFGLMHVEPLQVIYAPFLGAILHYVYWTTRSLWLSMLLHTLNNSLAVLAACKSTPLHDLFKWIDQITDNAVYPGLIYVGAVILLATVGYVLYQCRTRLEAESLYEPPWQPDYPGVEYPPPDSNTRVVHPGPSLAAWAVALGGFAVFVAACVVAVRGV